MEQTSAADLSMRAEVFTSPVRPVSERKDWLVNFENKNKEHYEKNQMRRVANNLVASTNVKPDTYIYIANKAAEISMDQSGLSSKEEDVYDFWNICDEEEILASKASDYSMDQVVYEEHAPTSPPSKEVNDVAVASMDSCESSCEDQFRFVLGAGNAKGEDEEEGEEEKDDLIGGDSSEHDLDQVEHEMDRKESMENINVTGEACGVEYEQSGNEHDEGI